MEVVKGNPYFCDCESKMKNYPYLNKNIDCDILIIGGGINGCIINQHLSKKRDVVLVEKGRLGFCCSSCATALLEYQLDDFAKDLKKDLKPTDVVKIYKMGLKSIQEIKQFVNKHGNHCEFSLKSSFVYTKSFFDVSKFKKEYVFRRQNGFKVKFINKKNNPFPFKVKAGLFCENGGAEFNPYLFCKQLIESSSNQDKIFEHTEIDMLERKGEKIIAKTNYGNIISCNKVIISTGFDEKITPEKNLSEKFVSYTIVTNKIEGFSWFDKTLIQDFCDPYHYLRLLPDDRIIFGGEDSPYNSKKPINEKLAKKKYILLEKYLLKLFPVLKNKIKVEYKFCGLFGSTDNNLGVIGKSLNDDKILYFLSCGANGIINAIFGRHLIEDILENKKNELEPLFSPKRLL